MDDGPRAVVIDVSLQSTRIGFAGGSCTICPPLPVDDSPAQTWIDDMATALSMLCEQAGGIQLEGLPICVTESIEQVNGPSADRERWVQWLFEKANAHSLYLLPRPQAALFGAGQSTGLVIDLTQVVPIYEGFALYHAVKQLGASQTVASIAFDAVFTCDCDIWKDLLSSVVVCGRDGSCGAPEVSMLKFRRPVPKIKALHVIITP